MKTKREPNLFMKPNFAFLKAAACVAMLLGASFARAELPAPDNLLYGAITVDGVPITAARTNFVIEAARTSGGVPVASYRVGANATIGNHYLLKLPLEELPGLQHSNSSLVGDTLYITIRSNGTVLAIGQALTHLIPERGHVRRLDIIVGTNPDADGDGLPDAWEILHFGSTTNNSNGDPDGDGVPNGNEFTGGTNPNNGDSFFHLTIVKTPAGGDVSFFAERAQGPGYDGRTRRYDLERSTNLVNSIWRIVPGYSNVLGNAQFVNYSIPDTNSLTLFFRCRIRLE
jgi:hypothetical protein